MSSIWLIICSLAAFAVAYRYYGAFIAAKVLVLDADRKTPACTINDGVDYQPTNKWVLFGHHFAAISGAGPLIGPVLAAQWGFLPGYSWIIIGSCLGGAVHDLTILVLSVRNEGKTMPEIVRAMLGRKVWLAASIATFFSLIAVLASTSVVVVNALAKSPWSTFVIVMTIIAALITGLWMYRIRPGKIVEASIIGVMIVLSGVFIGHPFSESGFAHLLIFSKPVMSIILPCYILIASILPVWMLMCPRDYLSSYMKIGVVAVLAVGILFADPQLNMPAVTPFFRHAPIITGQIWPFMFITIMCGAVSGWHALVSTGTTPKMLMNEKHALPIGFGAMLTEGFVAVMALVAACVLQPGDYFAINMPQDTPSQKQAYVSFISSEAGKSEMNLNPVDLKTLEEETQEKLAGRTGGGVTLAVGMAKLFTKLPGMAKLAAYWYHFIIMFEALFILTLLETGTRVGRFILQDVMVRETKRKTGKYNWKMNILTSFAVCFCWGYLLYTGTLNSLWTLFGIANQLFAATVLAIGTLWILNNSSSKKYALITLLPCVLLLVTATTAGLISIGRWSSAMWDIPAGEISKIILQVILIGMAMVLIVSALYITYEAVVRPLEKHRQSS
jgi:carbon starvation protein